MTKCPETKLDLWTRGIERYFQDCPTELVDLVSALRRREFIDPENWAIRCVKRKDEGLLLVKERGWTDLICLVGLFDANGSEEVVAVRTDEEY